MSQSSDVDATARWILSQPAVCELGHFMRQMQRVHPGLSEKAARGLYDRYVGRWPYTSPTHDITTGRPSSHPANGAA